MTEDGDAAEPMSDGIMYAPAAGHIRRLVSRHHKTPNLKIEDHSHFSPELHFCGAGIFDQILLTCESLAAASLAWMMNPLNLSIIIVRRMKMILRRRRRRLSSSQNTKIQKKLKKI